MGGQRYKAPPSITGIAFIIFVFLVLTVVTARSCVKEYRDVKSGKRAKEICEEAKEEARHYCSPKKQKELSKFFL